MRYMRYWHKYWNFMPIQDNIWKQEDFSVLQALKKIGTTNALSSGIEKYIFLKLWALKVP